MPETWALWAFRGEFTQILHVFFKLWWVWWTKISFYTENLCFHTSDIGYPYSNSTACRTIRGCRTIFSIPRYPVALFEQKYGTVTLLHEIPHSVQSRSQVIADTCTYRRLPASGTVICTSVSVLQRVCTWGASLCYTLLLGHVVAV